MTLLRGLGHVTVVAYSRCGKRPGGRHMLILAAANRHGNR